MIYLVKKNRSGGKWILFPSCIQSQGSLAMDIFFSETQFPHLWSPPVPKVYGYITVIVSCWMCQKRWQLCSHFYAGDSAKICKVIYILIKCLRTWKQWDSVLVIHCCIGNDHKLSGLKQLTFINSISKFQVGQGLICLGSHGLQWKCLLGCVSIWS